MIKYWLQKLSELLFMGIIVIITCGSYWGMWGKIGKTQNRLILYSLPPWQKQELARALNYYYNKNPVVKYSSGYLLRCQPSVTSIEKQFNWFYRNSFSAAIHSMPAYHTIVTAAYRSISKQPTNLKRYSTIELELVIAEKCHQSPFMTRKDISDIALSAISLGVRIIAYSINPILGTSLTVIGLINAARSDISKAVPGIICYMQIRCRNFIYSVLILFSFFTWLIFYMEKLRSPKKSASRGKRRRRKSVH